MRYLVLLLALLSGSSVHPATTQYTETITDKFIIINVAERRLLMFEYGQVIFDGNVIIEHQEISEYVTIDQITEIIINPLQGGYSIYTDGHLVDSIDEVEEGADYRIVQDPSKPSSIGGPKFNTQNKQDVCLNDVDATLPVDELCTYSFRVPSADLLASKILDWDTEAMDTIVDEQTTHSIVLSSPLPLFIVD